MTNRRNGNSIPRLEITTAAVRNPGVTVELEIREKVKLLIYCSTTGVLVWYYRNLTKIGPPCFE